MDTPRYGISPWFAHYILCYCKHNLDDAREILIANKWKLENIEESYVSFYNFIMCERKNGLNTGSVLLLDLPIGAQKKKRKKHIFFWTHRFYFKNTPFRIWNRRFSTFDSCNFRKINVIFSGKNFRIPKTTRLES